MKENQETVFYWLCLIGLKDDMKFTPQNHSAVKGQNPWLCLWSLIFGVPCRGAFPRGSPFSRARAYISPESPKLETTRSLLASIGIQHAVSVPKSLRIGLIIHMERRETIYKFQERIKRSLQIHYILESTFCLSCYF